MKGFVGSILEVNLTQRVCYTVPLDESLATRFLGGAGYACATLLPLLSKETDPLGADNILFFMTGPMGGTLATSTGRMVVCGKSPATGIWGESNACNDACVQIKKAGLDGIIFKGMAENPVYLAINDDSIEIKDAQDLWGKGIKETTTILKDLEGKQAKVIAIGPAGENLVKFALIGGENRAFGRLGMGAVMGSKKLKAIIVQGTKKIEVANPAELTEFVKETNKQISDNSLTQIFSQLGTSNGVELFNATGEMPNGYYRKPAFENADKISGAALAETYLKKNHHCFACPIGCGRVVAIGENDLNLPNGEFEGPEYETLGGFGSLMLNDNLKLIIKANYMCNDLGLDSISASSVIAFLMDLIEQGTITSENLDGIDLKWANMDAVFQLLEKIAYHNGIGALLGEGSMAIGKEFGIDPEQIAAIHNVEPTYHDMRAINGMALAYGISPHYGGFIIVAIIT